MGRHGLSLEEGRGMSARHFPSKDWCLTYLHRGVARTACTGYMASSRSLRRGAGAVERGGLENRCTRKGTVGSNPTLSATCPRESVLPIRLRPDFFVVFGGYAGGAVNRPLRQEPRKRSLRADILWTC